MKDHPEYHFDGSAPSNPWLAAIRSVEKRKRELGMETSRNVAVSGPEYFGLAVPAVAKLIMQMPNIEKCKKLKRLKIEADQRIVSRTMSAKKAEKAQEMKQTK